MGSRRRGSGGWWSESGGCVRSPTGFVLSLVLCCYNRGAIGVCCLDFIGCFLACNESEEVHTWIISSNLYFHILCVLSVLVSAALIVQAVVGLGEFGQLVQSNRYIQPMSGFMHLRIMCLPCAALSPPRVCRLWRCGLDIGSASRIVWDVILGHTALSCSSAPSPSC